MGITCGNSGLFGCMLCNPKKSGVVEPYRSSTRIDVEQSGPSLHVFTDDAQSRQNNVSLPVLDRKIELVVERKTWIPFLKWEKVIKASDVKPMESHNAHVRPRLLRKYLKRW